MPALQKILLLFAIDAGRDVTERVSIGIDEPMAGCDVTRRSNSYQADVTAMSTAKTMYSKTLDILK